MKLSDVYHAVKATTTAKSVPLEVFRERLNTCTNCPYLRDDSLYQFCSICKCRISSTHNRVFNLAAVEENLPEWGCKHPQRKDGAGWLR